MNIRLLVAALTVTTLSAQTQLTVYNQNFATVKENRTLELMQGENEVRISDITAHLEPESIGGDADAELEAAPGKTRRSGR